jgi:hypothetical protein
MKFIRSSKGTLSDLPEETAVHTNNSRLSDMKYIYLLRNFLNMVNFNETQEFIYNFFALYTVVFV